MLPRLRIKSAAQTLSSCRISKRRQSLMARSDQGVDRAMNDIAKRVPGKEIWGKEWNPRGGRPTDITDPDKSSVQPQMNVQLIARTELVL